MSPALRVLAVTLLVLVSCAALALLADALWGPSGWPKHMALSAEVEAITSENEGLSAQLVILKRQIAAQSERPEVQEALVRDLLGYVRPDDVVLHMSPAELQAKY
jgi:cell division protein FtsB